MNKANTGKKLIGFGLLFLLSILEYSFYLFLPQLRHSPVSTHVWCNLLITLALFSACCFVNYDLLGGLHRFLHKHSLDHPLASLVLSCAFCLLLGTLRFAGTAFAVNWTAVGRRLFIVLCLLYLSGRGSLPAELLRKCAPYRIAQAILLCVLSQLMFGGLAAAVYCTVLFSISDFLDACSLIGASEATLGLWLRTFAAFFLPLLSVYLFALGYKYFAAPEVLPLQARMLSGRAASYSLGLIAEAIRSSSHGYLLMFFMATLCTITAGILLIPLGNTYSDLQCNTIVLLSLAFLFFLGVAVIQLILNTELITRFFPFSTPASAVITVLLANSILNCDEQSSTQ